MRVSGSLDDLVVDVGDVHDEAHVVVKEACEDAADDVESNIRTVYLSSREQNNKHTLTQHGRCERHHMSWARTDTM